MENFLKKRLVISGLGKAKIWRTEFKAVSHCCRYKLGVYNHSQWLESFVITGNVTCFIRLFQLADFFPLSNNIKLFFDVNVSKLKMTRYRNEWVYIFPQMCDLMVMTVKWQNVLMVLLEEKLLTSGF